MCDCIKTTNELLKAHNATLVTTLFGTQKCSIEVEKADSAKRGKPPRLIATFCPFCGEKYEKATAPAEQQTS